jgi:hypothetical protein
MKRSFCDNLNHRRSHAQVRFCPKCGGIVNASILQKRCSEAAHDKSRRRYNLFCVDCGIQLRSGALARV